MWYFAWILGVGFACTLAIINGLWFELRPERIRVSHDPLNQ